jgi:hypothetical protein
MVRSSTGADAGAVASAALAGAIETAGHEFLRRFRRKDISTLEHDGKSTYKILKMQSSSINCTADKSNVNILVEVMITSL